MITRTNIYVVLEYWLTEADWDALQYEDSHSTLHQDETWGKSPERSGPNVFAFTTKELADECIAMRKKSYADQVKASEEHEWADCESDCVLCRTRMNEKTYSYEIKETDFIGETSTKNTTERYASYSKYVRSISAIGGTTLFVLTVIGMFMLANYVNAWEMANNYPYGKLCELYNNCSK